MSELTTDEVLTVLIEECAEVIKAATKCLRFGYTHSQPEYGVNNLVLAAEIGDVQACVDWLLSQDDGTMMDLADAARSAKIAKVKHWKEVLGSRGANQ